MQKPGVSGRNRRGPLPDASESARVAPAQFDAVPFTKLRKSRLVANCVEQLRSLILGGDLPPGSMLRQEEVSEMLGVSRTPLREALRVLERDGLVRTLPTSGSVEVVKLTVAEMLELSRVREVIDGLAARLVVEQGWSSELAGTLERTIREMQAAVDQPDRKRYVRAHTDFHCAIVGASRNIWMDQLMPLVSLGSQVFYLPLYEAASSSIGQPDAKYYAFLAEHIETHRELIDLLRGASPTAAERAARRHIALGRDLIAAYDRSA
jgi:GntR family transcriptional regulator of vanillate catabolism